MATVKHASYAGITIPLATPQLEERLMEIDPQGIFRDFDGWNFDQPNLQSLPTPTIPIPPEFRIGVLTWPTGISKPAFFHFVTTTARLNAIKAVQGSTNSAQPLVLYDGRSGKTITASMWMLPERPLNQLGNEFADAWLITLTDIRFYWHFRRSTITQPSSWSNLFSQIGAILGVSITVDTVDSRYLTPSSKWALPYAGSTPVILDAAAAQVGQRVVVGLNGSVRTVNWETARTESASYVSTADAIIAGGLIDEEGIARYVPESVHVLFLNASTTPAPPAPLVGTRTLTSLAIPAYGSATGVSNTWQTLNGDVAYTGSNGTEISDYADAMAEDWYGWRLSDTDLVWPGIEPFVPTGWEEVIEWTLQKRNPEPFASTLVRRGPWNDFQSGDWYVGTNPNIGPQVCGSGLTPACVPVRGSGGGSGSGSGSGGGNPGECDFAVEVVEVTCDLGQRQLLVTSIDVAQQDGRLILEGCSTNSFDLGPCSSTHPDGITLPVATLVCPIYADCVTVTSNYTAQDNDYIIYVDTSEGDIVISLPTALPGATYIIVNIGTGTVTIEASINGTTEFEITDQWEAAFLQGMCDGEDYSAQLLYPTGGGGGTGTVESITLTTANGLLVSGGVTQTITMTGTFALTLPITLAGSGTLTNSGVTALTAFTGSGTSSGTNTGDQFTSETASTLIGRGSASGTGAAQQIALGSGLTMTGTTLSATGSGGTVTSVTGTTNQVAVATGTTTPVISLAGPHNFTTLTIHGVLLGQTTGAITATAAMTNGQLLVGQTSADPLPKTLSGNATLTAAGAIEVKGVLLGESIVATSESTNSTTNVNLTTVQSVTINLPTTCDIIVELGATCSHDTVNGSARLVIDLDGTDTDGPTCRCLAITLLFPCTGGAIKLAGVSAGSHTFTMQFRTNLGTVAFEKRSMLIYRGP